MSVKTLKKFFLFWAVFCLSAPVAARAEEQQIAAVVNEDAITQKDLNDRMKLIMASSGMPNTPEIRKKLAPQVLNALIEEQIMLQEAKKLNLSLTDDDIENGFGKLAEQNKMSSSDFKGMMRRAGLSIATLQSQIRAHLSWSLVIQQKLRSRVSVTERDVDDVMERLQKNVGQSEYLLAEIFLPVDNAQAEGKAKQLASSMVSEIRAGRASFFKLAQQFSKSAGSSNGGDLGWVPENQLPEELQGVVKTTSANEVTDPVRSPNGYHILFLRDKRQLAADKLPTRDMVMQMLGHERLDRLQHGYLLDLKASSYIENRVES
ncbi:MAG: peptidylprolyl isomerase [Rhodospirillales bacterium]|nr:peptidylprolyl isomerase [Alphaproteobacteria bacterium]MCB9977090.1 peptidylprolyl isomerase [Rhodospirillales bacterium]MCB9977840.1 peptidylprolyl isomerase [Rhodospirillales bacterium]